MLATIPGFTALSIGTAAKIGFKPKFVVSNVGADYDTLAKQLGAAAPLLDGLVAANYLPASNDANDPWITLFKQINTKYNGNAAFDNNIVYGMSVAVLFVEALKATGKDLTRESLIAAVERGGFKGPSIAPLRFSKTDHSGYAGEQLSKVTGTTQAYFGDAYSTDDGDGPVKAYTPTVVPPEALPTQK
jgi:hypothetical protein